MEYKDCINCNKKDCVKCDKKDRFSIQSVCDMYCIVDNLTEEIYSKNDLREICNLLNKLVKVDV